MKLNVSLRAVLGLIAFLIASSSATADAQQRKRAPSKPRPRVEAGAAARARKAAEERAAKRRRKKAEEEAARQEAARKAAEEEAVYGAERAVYDAGRDDFDRARREIDAAKVAEYRRLKAEEEEGSRGFLPLPVVFYGPETYLGLGALGLYYWHSGEVARTRPSSVRSSVVGTTKGQFAFDIGPDLWLAEDTIHLELDASFVYFPDAFFGIGNDTPPESFESFTERSYGGVFVAQAQVLPKLYLGVRPRFDYRDILDREPGRMLVSDDVTGGAGGLTIAGGATITYDSRDNINAPSRGTFVDLAGYTFPKFIGSDFVFSQWRLEVRGYIPIGSTVLALQGVGEANAGDTPFYHLARLGGGNQLRGIFRGRYRDNLMLEGQAELRFPIYWRFGGVGFFGAGQVARTAKDFGIGGLHPAGGAGLRFAVVPNEKINIRVDVAYAAEGLSYYIDLSEAF